MIDIVIEGYLGRDCEIKKSPRNGKEYMNLTVATSERQKKDVYETFWFSVFCPNPMYFNLKDYLTKGRRVRVYGVLSNEKIYNHPTKGLQIDRIVRADRIDFVQVEKKEDKGQNNGVTDAGVSNTAMQVAQGVVMNAQMTPAEKEITTTVPPQRVVSNEIPKETQAMINEASVAPITGIIGQNTDDDDDLPF